MEIKQCILTNNDCYKEAKKIKPVGIVVHSTGANNPALKRYVQPDDGLLGVNQYANHWNRSGIEVCVHAFIGKDKNGTVRCYQTLPWDYACWGVGRGSKGSYNYNPTGHIQFEICEDGLDDHAYFNAAFGTAEDLCAELCYQFDLPVESVVSHAEAAKKGYASNHGDPDHWLKKYSWTMDNFRAQVKSRLDAKKAAVSELYRVRLKWEDADSQIGAYSVLENAKKSCPVGYTVYDKSGKAVYTNVDAMAAIKAENAQLKQKIATLEAVNKAQAAAIEAALAALNKVK